MNTNMIGLRRFSKIPRILVLWTEVASTLEGSRHKKCHIFPLCFNPSMLGEEKLTWMDFGAFNHVMAKL